MPVNVISQAYINKYGRNLFPKLGKGKCAASMHYISANSSHRRSQRLATNRCWLTTFSQISYQLVTRLCPYHLRLSISPMSCSRRYRPPRLHCSLGNYFCVNHELLVTAGPFSDVARRMKGQTSQWLKIRRGGEKGDKMG